MRDAMVGTVVGALIIAVLSYAAVAQSASERYPDHKARTSLLVWRDLAWADRDASRDVPPGGAGLREAYRDGYRAGWQAARGGPGQ